MFRYWKSEYFHFISILTKRTNTTFRLPRLKVTTTRWKVVQKPEVVEDDPDEYLCTCMSHWGWRTTPCENCN